MVVWRRGGAARGESAVPGESAGPVFVVHRPALSLTINHVRSS